MRVLLVITALAVALTGCATYYTHPKKGTAQFERDKRDCERIAERESARKGTRICDEIDRCLVGTKGWHHDR